MHYISKIQSIWKSPISRQVGHQGVNSFIIGSPRASVYDPHHGTSRVKPAFTMCEQQRRRSAWAFGQSNQRLYCSLLRWYNISSFYIQNFKLLASFGGCAGRFESYLVENPEDRFPGEEAQIMSPLYLH